MTDTLAPAERRQRLEEAWGTPPTLWGRLTAVNHKVIGKRYIVTAGIFFILAGIMALVMRVQLAQPDADVLSAEAFNQFFTMHGTVMMFLFAVPMMEGIGIYLVPLMLGTRDLVFPKLNAFGYYVYLISGVTLFFSFFTGQAPDGGWFNYVPFTGPRFSPENNIDFWATMITFLEIAALVAAVEIILTIARTRAAGMALHRMPVFCWAQLVMSMMIVFAMPVLMIASVLLALDRLVGTGFYDPAAGGDPVLWQHLFWFFGHPEVYIILIPALGIVSMIVPVFSRQKLVGYTPVVLAIVAIGVLSFGLWVHHMFAVGLPHLGEAFFAAASFSIAIPSGVQIFAWIATIARGERPRLTTPMWYVLGFIFIFVLGGITGVMVAAIPFDLQVHDTYFVVAHFHYVLVGGAVFPLIGGFYFWFPKVTGRLLSDRAGKWSFWLVFAGFNLTFFPMHLTGFAGMPRRVYTYHGGLGWTGLNLVSSISAFLIAAGVLVTLLNALWARRRGEVAGDDPWGASTLEWATTSPPPNYNFEHFPVIDSREPVWDGTIDRAPDEVDWILDEREIVGTSSVDAIPEQRMTIAGNSIWPLFLAIAVGITFLGAIYTIAAVPIGAFLAFLSLTGWFWPGKSGRWQ